ncbi:hypothetical protein, partial [Geomonas sp. Red276]
MRAIILALSLLFTLIGSSAFAQDFVWRRRFSWTRDCAKSSDQGDRTWKTREAVSVQRRESVARPTLHL